MDSKKEKPKKHKNLETKIKTISYVLLLIVGAYMLLSAKFTGLSISSSTRFITGSFLGTITFFFLLLLFLIKIKLKPYKTPKSQ